MTYLIYILVIAACSISVVLPIMIVFVINALLMFYMMDGWISPELGGVAMVATMAWKLLFEMAKDPAQ